MNIIQQKKIDNIYQFLTAVQSEDELYKVNIKELEKLYIKACYDMNLDFNKGIKDEIYALWNCLSNFQNQFTDELFETFVRDSHKNVHVFLLIMHFAISTKLMNRFAKVPFLIKTLKDIIGPENLHKDTDAVFMLIKLAIQVTDIPNNSEKSIIARAVREYLLAGELTSFNSEEEVEFYIDRFLKVKDLEYLKPTTGMHIKVITEKRAEILRRHFNKKELSVDTYRKLIDYRHSFNIDIYNASNLANFQRSIQKVFNDDLFRELDKFYNFQLAKMEYDLGGKS